MAKDTLLNFVGEFADTWNMKSIIQFIALSLVTVSCTVTGSSTKSIDRQPLAHPQHPRSQQSEIDSCPKNFLAVFLCGC
jgi:hypothetical protein